MFAKRKTKTKTTDTDTEDGREESRSRPSSFHKRLIVSFILIAVHLAVLHSVLATFMKLGGANQPTAFTDTPPLTLTNTDTVHDAAPTSPHGSAATPAAGAAPTHKTTDAIVYLAQFGHHSSYGAQVDAAGRAVTGAAKLNISLDLLYANYARDFPTDVLVFYDVAHAPDAATRAALQRGRPHLHFRPLDDQTWWRLPPGLHAAAHVFWARPAFSVGYRLMMRWYAVLIWFYLRQEGYTHVMRLDDDSHLLSTIRYNLFDYMRDNNKKYAFRQPVFEPGGEVFDALVDRVLAEYPNMTTPELIDLYKQDRGVAFYNNFFMADVAFFLTPPAAILLQRIDDSRLIFTQRTGDLVIHSAVVRLFLPPAAVHWFQDFTYEHMTLCRKDKCGPWVPKGCPQNGGVSRGVGLYTDAEWRAFAHDEVQQRFKDNPQKCSVPINQHFVGAEDVRTCSRLDSRCGFYLKLLSGFRAEESTWRHAALHELGMGNFSLAPNGTRRL